MEKKQRQLLLKVADHIQTVPSISDYSQLIDRYNGEDKVFGMWHMCYRPSINGQSCGTSHCVLGWGWELSGNSRTPVCRVFGHCDWYERFWLFASFWDTHPVAWTAKAAAHRIYYYLVHGKVPDSIMAARWDWEKFVAENDFITLCTQAHELIGNDHGQQTITATGSGTYSGDPVNQ